MHHIIETSIVYGLSRNYNQTSLENYCSDDIDLRYCTNAVTTYTGLTNNLL